MTDLSVVASRLSRAADKLEERIEAAPKGAEWGHLLRQLQADAYPPEFVFFVAWADPRTVAALVPLLRRAAKYALWAIEAGERHRRTFELDDWEADLLKFAALLLGEEETGG